MDITPLLGTLPRPPFPGDFDAYYAVGKHMVEGAHTYNETAVLALQQSLGRAEDYANLVWYAPHILPLFAFFGLLPYGLAWLTWLALQMTLLFVAADRLWILAGGPKEKRHYPLLFAVAFYPTLILASWRQASALLLAGLVGFLTLHRSRRDFAAGACLALFAIKPQLAYLVWIGLVIHLLRTRRYAVFLGLAATVLAGASLAFAINPDFFRAYLEHLLRRPPNFLLGPPLGAQLRLLFGAQHYWLQFLPALFGMVWFLASHPARPFIQRLPALISASFVFSVFYWTADLVLLLTWMIPVLAARTIAGDRRAVRAFVVPVAAISTVTLVAHQFLHDHNFYVLTLAYAWLYVRHAKESTLHEALP